MGQDPHCSGMISSPDSSPSTLALSHGFPQAWVPSYCVGSEGEQSACRDRGSDEGDAGERTLRVALVRTPQGWIQTQLGTQHNKEEPRNPASPYCLGSLADALRGHFLGIGLVDFFFQNESARKDLPENCRLPRR